MNGGNILTYKGYMTRVEYSAEDGILFGKIEGITDLVNFECESVSEVEDAFHEAVEDYLAYCADLGQEPDRVYKGTFNVRVTPELHRALDRAAYKEGISMNQYIEKALSEYVDAHENSRIHGTYQASEEKSVNSQQRIISYWTTNSMQIASHMSYKNIGDGFNRAIN